LAAAGRSNAASASRSSAAGSFGGLAGAASSPAGRALHAARRAAEGNEGAEMSTNTIQRTMPGAQSLDFTREFEAPAERVFEAHVNPDLVARWIGPHGTTLRMRE